MLAALIVEIQSLYAEIDRDIAAFKLATGLRCRNGCGQCCPGAQIRVSAAEMLPAAAALLRSGAADIWLERLAAGPDTCVGFSPAPVPETGGHCTLYAQRPIVCRLFGFAASRNRRSELELSTCRIIKADAPEAVARAAQLLAAGQPAPLLTAYGARVFSLDPTAHALPINQAMDRALERCGLAFGLQALPVMAELPRAS